MVKYIWIWPVLVFLLWNCKAKDRLDTEDIVESVDRSLLFPLDWIGIYEGRLHIFQHRGDTTTIDMRLQIDYPNPEGYYPWVLQYGEKDFRYYGLEVINPDAGHYRIDEFNSIKLDAFLRENHFISKFNVNNTDITVDYVKTARGIDIYFYISGEMPINTTGGEIIGKDTIPMVYSYPLSGFQKAVLLKVKS